MKNPTLNSGQYFSFPSSIVSCVSCEKQVTQLYVQIYTDTHTLAKTLYTSYTDTLTLLLLINVHTVA